MQMFAMEVLDNAANLAAVFYTIHATPRYARPLSSSKNNTPRLLMGAPHSGSNCRSLNGSIGGGVFSSTDSGGYCTRR